jgi:hypothetical protein
MYGKVISESDTAVWVRSDAGVEVYVSPAQFRGLNSVPVPGLRVRLERDGRGVFQLTGVQTCSWVTRETLAVQAGSVPDYAI